MLIVSRLIFMVATAAGVVIVPAGSSFGQVMDAALTARMAKEKEARRACKIEICKAFASPADGTPIACDVTKTWLRSEIVGRVTGGSYIWGYGNMQCSLKLNLDRGQIGKAFVGAKSDLSFPEHKLTCNVDSKDPSKGKAFTVNIALTPKVTFANGKATAVSIEPVKTEGSSLASGAVTSMMAVDRLSGVVSRAAASEINAFLFSKCADDGVKIEPKK